MSTTERLDGKWERLDDGAWGVSVRCGGRGEAMVGRDVHVATRDKRMTVVTLGALVRDYGRGDVAIYRRQEG